MEYTLQCNNGKNHLHGGVVGFDKRRWAGEVVGDSAVRFSYTSADGEEGDPGELHASVTYQFRCIPAHARPAAAAWRRRS